MEARPDVIEVVYENGWKIGFGKYRFGPYDSKRDAVDMAHMWAEDGRKKGLSLAVRVPDPVAALGSVKVSPEAPALNRFNRHT